MFWSASKDEMIKGYLRRGGAYICLICEETFEIGRIHEIDGALYDAEKAAQLHIKAKHGSMLSYLLNMNHSYTGITEVQRDVLLLVSQGLTDKEIAKKLGVADSTIRNHRYKLREKEKQAKVFQAMMEMLSMQTEKEINKLDEGILCDAHKTATTLDDRYNITDIERLDIIKKYFNENGGLKNFPAREKRKIIILSEIMKNFSPGKKYREQEMNRILKRIYEDYATIRRALIEYGFMDRTNDGSSYWVKE
jgi:DNA-binding CsgD family transcriptional regulator